MNRFVITGSGRSGTQYMSELLRTVGIRCGHENVYFDTGFLGWKDWEADSSWMASCFVPLQVPTVLVVRHPLRVVKSWVETWLSSDPRTPKVPVFRKRFPEVYRYRAPHDRALAQWLLINRTCQAHALATYRLETFGPEQLVHLLRTVRASRQVTLDEAMSAIVKISTVDRYASKRSGLHYTPNWDVHDRKLATQARALAAKLGYGDTS